MIDALGVRPPDSKALDAAITSHLSASSSPGRTDRSTIAAKRSAIPTRHTRRRSVNAGSGNHGPKVSAKSGHSSRALMARDGPSSDRRVCRQHHPTHSRRIEPRSQKRKLEVAARR